MLFSGTLHAQDTENQQQRSSATSPLDLNFDFNSLLGGYYYQDALLSILGDELAGMESIDRETYQLGPNDVISIRITGNQQILMRGLFVNTQGDVVLPVIGNVNLSGQTITQAEETLKKVTSETFRDPEVSVTLEYAKPVVYFVNGDIPYPGKFTLPPQTRVDQAIYPAIVESGSGNQKNLRTSELLNQSAYSYRNILIKHQDGTSSRADLVSYFKTGKLEDNPIIRSGDQVSLKRLTNRSPKVSISGAVNSSAELEYSNSDTPSLLIEIAGGLTNDADSSKLYIYRRAQNETSRIELSRNEWDSFTVQPNDRIVVPELPLSNQAASAWITGEVNMPGNFPIESGETTALELLDIAGELTSQALPSAAYMIRAGSPENEIPNKFNSDLLKRTSDQLAQGFEYLDLETQVSRNKVFIDLNDEDQLSKVKIYDGDRIFVPRDEETIFVFGQVNNPGYYPFTDPNESVTDYIQRAGGFALSADQERIFIIKAGSGTWYRPQETELQSGDRIFIDRIPYDELNARRTYEVQKEQIKNTRIQLILTGISTITGIITTYVAITR
tara:strand:- start:38284 stop:39957 length:1674 start_codon:yes stop_codon:yes gene_type:complete